MEIEGSKIESILSKYKKIRDQILAEPELTSDYQLPTDYNRVFFPDDLGQNSKFALKASESQKSIATFSNGISSKFVLKTPEFNQLSKEVEQNLVENHLKIEHLENCLNLQKTANQSKFKNIIQHYDNILSTAQILRSQIDTENNSMNCAFDKIKEDISNIQNDLNSDFNIDFEKLMVNFDTLPKLNENSNKTKVEDILQNSLKKVKFQLTAESDTISNYNERTNSVDETDLNIPPSIQTILKSSGKKFSFQNSSDYDRIFPLKQGDKIMFPVENEHDVDCGPYIRKDTSDVIESNLNTAKDFRVPPEKHDIVNEISMKYSKGPNINVKNRKNTKAKIKFRK